MIYMDEPPIRSVSMFILFRNLQAKREVVLSGDGGDENFATTGREQDS
jgi:asparagine synthetase B (glutamine-hydrolysing)